MRLVDDLSDEDLLAVFGLHLHPFEGRGVALTELASYHYAVDLTVLLRMISEHPYGPVLYPHPTILQTR